MFYRLFCRVHCFVGPAFGFGAGLMLVCLLGLVLLWLVVVVEGWLVYGLDDCAVRGLRGAVFGGCWSRGDAVDCGLGVVYCLW